MTAATAALLSLAVVAPVPAGDHGGAAPPSEGGVSATAPTAQDRWDAWPSARVASTPSPCLRPADLQQAIRRLADRHREGLAVEEVARSVRGRPISLLTLGRGPRRILLWSQMHGDEPSATPALLDVAHALLSGAEPEAQAILEGLTLLVVPMLNPDGAERYARRNAQGIDVNRDALQLATPEGRLLKSLRDRFEPELGFNLHDQNRRRRVGASGRLATLALLAVAGDAKGTMTAGRSRAKRACAAIVRALEPLVPGGIARYDEDWNARAFGDNLTRWGTPVVLIESGGLLPDRAYEDLTRLNVVALLTVLSGLVRDDLGDEDPALYDDLPRNEDGLWVDVLVTGGEVWQPGAGDPYRSDVAFDVLDSDRARAGCEISGEAGPSRVREVGDGRLLGTARRIDADGRLVVPALAVSMRGLVVREWLDDEAASALARLGVFRVRWHVTAAERAPAEALARALEGPGLPLIEVADVGERPHFLEVAGPLSAPRSSRLDAVLDALAGADWHARARGRPLSELLPPLAGDPDVEEEGPLLKPDAPASFLILRPEPSSGRDASELFLETVFIDGREPEGAP